MKLQFLLCLAGLQHVGFFEVLYQPHLQEVGHFLSRLPRTSEICKTISPFLKLPCTKTPAPLMSGAGVLCLGTDSMHVEKLSQAVYLLPIGHFLLCLLQVVLGCETAWVFHGQVAALCQPLALHSGWHCTILGFAFDLGCPALASTLLSAPY